MYNSLIAIHTLTLIKESLEIIIKRTEVISSSLF